MDAFDEAEQFVHEMPEERLMIALRSSRSARRLALAAGELAVTDYTSALQRKADLYAAPLRRVGRSWMKP